jgi:hypothetical protein
VVACAIGGGKAARMRMGVGCVARAQTGEDGVPLGRRPRNKESLGHEKGSKIKQNSVKKNGSLGRGEKMTGFRLGAGDVGTPGEWCAWGM